MRIFLMRSKVFMASPFSFFYYFSYKIYFNIFYFLRNAFIIVQLLLSRLFLTCLTIFCRILFLYSDAFSVDLLLLITLKCMALHEGYFQLHNMNKGVKWTYTNHINVTKWVIYNYLYSGLVKFIYLLLWLN